MTIRELARAIRDELEVGINDVVIFKRRKQWFYHITGALGDVVLEAVKLSDPQAIMVNGWDNFSNYSLKGIANQVKTLHSA